MYDEQYCFLTILAYYLGSIDCCYIKLTSILFVFWDTLDCEQEKQFLLWNIDKTIAEYKTRRKKTNKQTKEKTPLPKKAIKHKEKNNKQTNQTGIVFSVFCDICVDILQNYRHILQYQITTCI